MTGFDRAFEIVVGHEGGFVNNPADPGGATKYGVSQRSYPSIDIAALTLEGAREIYRRDFWAPLRCDDMPWAVALVLFDSGINSGVGAAARWLQTAVRVNRDGAIGPVTLAAVAGLAPGHVAGEILAARLYLMTGLPQWGTFGLGWTRRLARLAFQAAER